MLEEESVPVLGPAQPLLGLDALLELEAHRPHHQEDQRRGQEQHQQAGVEGGTDPAGQGREEPVQEGHDRGFGDQGGPRHQRHPPERRVAPGP
ncbi:MAG: hypothetical protein ACYDA8_07175, partial [Deferrisomatales bacterium]